MSQKKTTVKKTSSSISKSKSSESSSKIPTKTINKSEPEKIPLTTPTKKIVKKITTGTSETKPVSKKLAEKISSKISSPKSATKKTTPQTIPKKTTIKPTTAKTPEQIQEDKERLEGYKKAGQISKKIKEFIRPKIVSGAKLLELVELAEKKIIELGGKPGFPVNISLNNIAAHYTPPPGDSTQIQEGDIVKFDFGVHIDGYSVDTAFTVSLNNEPTLKNLVKASEEAVTNAIKKIKHGITTNILGQTIEETVRNYGFKPVINLQGHRIERWDLHAGKSIPCISQPTGSTMEEGEIYAVEVFVSNGEGIIHAQQSNTQIFQLIPTERKIPLRTTSAKRILGYLIREFKTLPFSRFQVHQEFPQSVFGLLELIKTNKLEQHNILSERKGFYIAQTEHTILVTKTGHEILT